MNRTVNAIRVVCMTALCGGMFGASAAAQQLSPAASQKPAASSATQSSSAPRVLSLEEVVNLALQHSPDLALARVRFAVAQNTTGLARAEFRPNLYTGSGAAYTNGFPETPGGSAPAVFEMSYQQALFDTVKSADVHANEQFAKNAQLEYQNTRESIIMQAASFYLELADVQRSLDLIQSARDSAQRIVELSTQREAAGLELPATVTQAQLQEAKLSQELVSYQDRQETLLEQIRDMTGLPANEPLQISQTEFPASESAEAASNVITEALDHSAALREAENFQRARAQLLKGAKGAYWPTVSIIGEYSVLSKINNYQDFFRKFQRNNVTAGISVTIPIFAARTSANVALAKSNLDEASLQLTQAKRLVQEGAEQKVRALKEADAAKEVARLDLQLAQQQLQDAQAQFNQGHKTLAELEQMHVAESQKWLAFLDADLTRERAQLDLLKTTGQLAQVFHQ